MASRQRPDCLQQITKKFWSAKRRGLSLNRNRQRSSAILRIWWGQSREPESLTIPVLLIELVAWECSRKVMRQPKIELLSVVWLLLLTQTAVRTPKRRHPNRLTKMPVIWMPILAAKRGSGQSLLQKRPSKKPKSLNRNYLLPNLQHHNLPNQKRKTHSQRKPCLRADLQIHLRKEQLLEVLEITPQQQLQLFHQSQTL